MNKLSIFCFTSVARTGSFSITAKELMISQQAVSKQIRSLEDELGYQLFFRDGRSVLLTQAGKYLMEYFSQRNELIDEILQEFNTSAHEFTLNIGLSQWTGYPDWFNIIIQKFRKDIPHLQLHLLDLNAEEAISAVKNEKVDFLLISRYMSKYLPTLWKSIQVTQHPIYLIKNSHSEYRRDQLGLYPFFATASCEEGDNAVYARIKRTCKQLGFFPENITILNDMGSVLLNVLLNNGIALGTAYEEKWNTPDFVFEKTTLSADIVLCAPHHTTNPMSQKFIEFFLKETENLTHE